MIFRLRIFCSRSWTSFFSDWFSPSILQFSISSSTPPFFRFIFQLEFWHQFSNQQFFQRLLQIVPFFFRIDLLSTIIFRLRMFSPKILIFSPSSDKRFSSQFFNSEFFYDSNFFTILPNFFKQIFRLKIFLLIPIFFHRFSNLKYFTFIFDEKFFQLLFFHPF